MVGGVFADATGGRCMGVENLHVSCKQPRPRTAGGRCMNYVRKTSLRRLVAAAATRGCNQWIMDMLVVAASVVTLVAAG